MRKCRTAALGLAMSVALSAAHAQVAPIDGWGWTILVPSVSQTDILGSQLRDRRQQDERRAVSSASPAAIDPAVLRYLPSKTRREANFSGFLAKTKARDPAGARNLEELFAGGDVIARMTPVLGAYGLRVDDVADAYAVWWVNAWQASHRRSDTPNKAVYAAVRAQAARALASTPELASADDGAKQKFAEALLIQSVLLDAAMDQAKTDPTRLGLLARAAAEGGRGMGLDLAAMELTAAGFAAARR